MRVLVTGGAGYIGSHAVKMLIEAGHRVVAVDNLTRGHSSAVHRAARFVRLDLHETARLAQVLHEDRIECVMHFAALAYVGESVTRPLDYYQNNTAGTLSLLQAMREAGVSRIVFSSTCATYGEPPVVPIVEMTPQRPINPYGRSKLVVERVLADVAAAHSGFAYAALRYFNVAGAAADGSLGEDHRPETHLIPAAILSALGKRGPLTVFGRDYATADGTCIRDYIHVEDLCAAHLCAMNALSDGDQRIYNLGIGRGYSVAEVIAAVEEVGGIAVPRVDGPRRPGDPAVLYADASKITHELSWRPQYTRIEPIVETAWRWFRNHPDGYPD